ncbi:MAG: hypothetical protein IT306_08600 [Chloroflexi bacterium]|nr:hypothetical protein [Chloroflexota bacterium]
MVDAQPLRIVSLNTWGGKVLQPLLWFLRQQADTTDVFCFQEILHASANVPLDCGFRTDLYAELSTTLHEFEGRFDTVVSWDQPRADGLPPIHVPFGLATFVRRGLPIVDRGCEPIIVHDDTLDAVPGVFRTARKLQWIRVRGPSGGFLIANFHGMARPGTKLDNEERLEQSRAIRRVMDRHSGPALLVGDFNLLAETLSVRLLEYGRRNLIAEYAIETTRSKLNPYYGTPQEQKHANFAFATPGLDIASFRVPDVEVSDHLPMLISVRP